MGMSLILVLALIYSATTLVFGFIRKDKRLKIIGGVSLFFVVVIVALLLTGSDV